MRSFKKHIEEGRVTPGDLKAQAEGKKAARKGVKYDDNPYEKGSSRHLQWSKGHNAARAGMLKKEEVEQIEESTGKYKATSEKSKFGKGGYRPHLKNPEGKTSYLAGVSYKSHEHAAGEAAAYHKGYTSGPGKANERGAERAVAAYRAKNKEHMHEEVEQVDEVLDTPKAMDSYKNKAKASKDKATNSAVAKIMRGGDHSAELKTRSKREKGLAMADRNATKKTFKKLRNEEVEVDENLNFMIPKGKAASDYMSRKAKMRQDQHKEQDPKHAKTHAKNMVDMDKAAAKAKKKGVKMRDYGKDTWKVRNGVKRGKLPEGVELSEADIAEILHQYALSENVNADQLAALTEEEINEIIGKAIGGAFKLGAKAAVGAGRMVKKAANRMSTSGRADAAEKKAAALEKKNKDRERIKAAQERLRKAKEASRNK